MPTPAKQFKVDNLTVKIFKTRDEMGRAAAMELKMDLEARLAQESMVRMVFAAAPSQNEFLENLIRFDEVDWSRVEAFHMDEYIGLNEVAPERFGYFLKQKLFDKLPFGHVHYLNPDNRAPRDSVIYYQGMLKSKAPDIVALGIGENGHIAFNDPPVADFLDPNLVKIVELDDVCRQQQVNDECFPSFEAVPEKAITLTIPALISGKSLFCMVPGKTKQQAVYKTLYGEISEECPASILRRHERAVLYLDEEAAALL
jgi:glucosamine-6-phosphate deaminase